MPRYKIVDQPTYIGSTMRQIGEVVEHGGWPGSTLEPADPVASKIKDFYVDVRKRGRKFDKAPDVAAFAAQVDKAKSPAKPDKVEKDKANV